VPQGNSPCSYLKQQKNVIFFLLFLFFCKIVEQENGTGPNWCGQWGVGGMVSWYLWEPGGGCKMVNESEWAWCKYCVHMYVNGKIVSVETIPGMGGGGYEGE
jgi:hypothetical protein